MQIIDLTPNREYLIGLALLEANNVDPRTILRRHAITDDHISVVTFERLAGWVSDNPVVEHIDVPLPVGHPWRNSR